VGVTGNQVNGMNHFDGRGTEGRSKCISPSAEPVVSVDREVGEVGRKLVLGQLKLDR
jgi:hypothetical protein